jgi:NACHT domain
MGKSLLKIWLKEQPLLAAAGTGSIDLLKSKTTDVLAARRAAREFETLGDRIAKSLEPIFKSCNLQENSYHAVAKEVSSAIFDAKISSRLLAELSHNPIRLLEHIKGQHPKGDALFSEAETSLYNRVLDLAAQYIIDLASNLPDYTAQNFTQILQRLDISMETLERVLDDLEKLRVLSENFSQNKQYADFERDYRALIVRKFDRVDLFGADVSKRAKRYQLSIAYVSLEVANPDFYDEDVMERTDVQEALSNSWQTAIIGEAGTGKTTLLHWLAMNSAANTFEGNMAKWNNSVPFIIELRRYSEELPSPEKFLNKVAFEIADRMPKGWVHHALESGRAVLLIDGLDEVPEAQRESVYDWLEYLCESFDVRIVFTSRPASYEWGELSYLNFQEYELAPMQSHQIECFINYWHQAVIGNEEFGNQDKIENVSKKLLYKIRNSLPLTRLATNPLLCAMLCALHYERNMQLPADRSELYEACCSMLLERRDSEREINTAHYPTLSYKQKRVLLDDLAYWMMKNQYVSIEKWQMIPRVDQRLNNMQVSSQVSSEIVVSLLVERSGVIREPTPDSIDFIHRTFQEYMAASAASVEGDWGFLLDRASDDQWQETIILAAGFSNKKQADYFVGYLLEKGEKAPDKKHKFDLLAISCLETVVEISSEVRDRVEQRVNSLIPPKRRDEIKPLAAAGEIAISYLRPKPEYSTQEAVACVQVLQMIGTQAAFTQALAYLKDKRTAVIEEIYNFLDLVTPEEVAASNSDSLIEFISESIQDDEVKIHGKVIHALSRVPSSHIKLAFSSKIKKLYLDYLDDTLKYNLSIVSQLPFLEELVIDGCVDDFEELANLKNLKILDIRNYHLSDWPSFNSMQSLENFVSLKLSSVRLWPDFQELKSFPNLESLSILSNDKEGIDYQEIDYQVIEAISDVKQLKHVHISITGKNSIWPDLASLGRMNHLKTLEISSDSDFQNIHGFDKCSQMKKLIINTVSRTNISQTLLSQIEFFCPQCSVEIIEGWEEEQW